MFKRFCSETLCSGPRNAQSHEVVGLAVHNYYCSFCCFLLLHAATTTTTSTTATATMITSTMMTTATIAIRSTSAARAVITTTALLVGVVRVQNWECYVADVLTDPRKLSDRFHEELEALHTSSLPPSQHLSDVQ